ncbi:MAG: NTP transferase domain-containing protein [Candidatus Bathyarchaeota archaeon]|nr:NTP transferase domain-containing protein [Candidatus Bathyarchaeota archaeon]
MTMRAAIILAGGKAQRFQTKEGTWQDKALALLDGKPLLAHVLLNVADVVDESVVVVNENFERHEKYSSLIVEHNIRDARLITDIKIDDLSGPLVAILTGLKAVDAELCLTVPCDMPLLNPKVAQYFLSEIDDSTVAVPMWPDGRLETLLTALHRQTALQIADALTQLDRSRPDDIIRGSQNALFVSPFGKIRQLDPQLCSFVNVNSPEELSRLQPRQGQGESGRDLRLKLGDLPQRGIEKLKDAAGLRKGGRLAEASEIFAECAEVLEREGSFFWAAISREFQAKSLRNTATPQLASQTTEAFQKAAQNYNAEAAQYNKNGCYLLAKRAMADKTWNQTQTKQ